jgi:cysteinyl-tRNA synthetase
MTASNMKKACVRPTSHPLIESLESRTLFSALPAPVAPAVADSYAKTASNLSVVAASSTAMPLSSVHTFAYVLSDLSNSPEITEMAQSKYDMLIVDPNATFKGNASFNMAAMVSQLHAADPGRVVLAYISIGEASSDRTYWQNNWRAPSGKRHGNPAYILGSDPFGWTGSYPVAYWNPAWQNLFIGKNGMVPALMKAGFDGFCLGWVGGFSDSTVAAAAHRAGVNPAKAMVQFISKIRKVVKANNPDGVVVGEDADTLAVADPAYLNVIDAGIFEDTWFYGTPNSPWEDPAGGDLPTAPSATAALIANYQRFKSAGKPVFTVDYALESPDADLAYVESSELGFVPYVTEVSLNDLTTTPPPWLD